MQGFDPGPRMPPAEAHNDRVPLRLSFVPGNDNCATVNICGYNLA